MNTEPEAHSTLEGACAGLIAFVSTLSQVRHGGFILNLPAFSRSKTCALHFQSCPQGVSSVPTTTAEVTAPSPPAPGTAASVCPLTPVLLEDRFRSQAAWIWTLVLPPAVSWAIYGTFLSLLFFIYKMKLIHAAFQKVMENVYNGKTVYEFQNYL